MTKLEEFRLEMEPLKEKFTQELKEYVKKYDFLGELTIIEEPDIDTSDYIFSFEKLNDVKKEVADSAMQDIDEHMLQYSKLNNLDDFTINACILYDYCLL